MRMRTSSVEAVRSTVANGLGVTLKKTVPTMNIGMGWKKGADHTPAMAAFFSHFKQIFLNASHARGLRVRG